MKKLWNTCITVASLLIFLGCLWGMSHCKLPVDVVHRPVYGTGDNIYHLQVEKEGVMQQVQLIVPELDPTEEDWDRIKQEVLEYAQKRFAEEVVAVTPESPVMQLPDQYKDCKMQWTSLSKPVVDDDGYVWFALWNGEPLQFDVVLSLAQFKAVYRLEGKIPYEAKADWKESLQTYIDSQSKEYISLPKQWEGEEMTFYQSSGKWLIFPTILAAGILMWQGLVKEQVKKKKEQRRIRRIQREFPSFLSRLILYLQGGMSLRKAWDRLIAGMEDKRSELLAEMLLARNQIYSGIGEGRAYEEFGIRCGNYAYKRVARLLSQAVDKSGEYLMDSLEEELEHYYLEEKNLARKNGEEAGTKLLIPTGIQFVFLMLTMMMPVLFVFQQ